MKEDQLVNYVYKGITFYTPNKRFAWMRPRPLGKNIRIKKNYEPFNTLEL